MNEGFKLTDSTVLLNGSYSIMANVWKANENKAIKVHLNHQE